MTYFWKSFLVGILQEEPVSDRVDHVGRLMVIWNFIEGWMRKNAPELLVEPTDSIALFLVVSKQNDYNDMFW